MANIQSLTTDALSYYRTLHHFEKYGEVNTLDEFHKYCDWAEANKVKIYILGNGSNTLFTRKHIRTLILKNNLTKNIKHLSTCRLEVSSSVLVIDVLKYCYENSLDSFYYLASVPATIGGALAMNAGRGKIHECTIYDFVESVTFFDNGSILTLNNEQIVRSYRETIFTGIHTRFIISAVFYFEQKEVEFNPLLDRKRWVKEHQDNTAPNCGSVFKLADSSILDKLKGISIGKVCFSSKTRNWILNKSKSSVPIIILINLAKTLHFITGKKIFLELITVD